jgi:hypothetical protein
VILLLGGVDQAEAHFDLLEIVLFLGQDRFTVCAECTMALEIILDTPNGTLR